MEGMDVRAIISTGVHTVERSRKIIDGKEVHYR